MADMSLWVKCSGTLANDSYYDDTHKHCKNNHH